ncbi:MAG: hypothetical protein KC800_04720 [Candidatus Eremiobacteraeota bacterium]|nr:hypothetical protein [Candidatus Eremiobacteraeota bacterium]
MKDDFEFREPWEAADDPQSIQEQLEQVLSPGHPLTGNVLEVVATRVDSDDVLLRTKTGYAMVHLGWCRRSQASLPFPHSVYFEDWNAFYESVYLPDLEEWDDDNPSDDWSEILGGC